MISLTDKVIKNEDVVTADMDGETVMLDIESGNYFNLGTTGGVIWKTLDNEITVEMLIENLVELYDVGKEKCTEDTIAFLNQIAEKGMIKIGD